MNMRRKGKEKAMKKLGSFFVNFNFLTKKKEKHSSQVPFDNKSSSIVQEYIYHI